MGIHPVFRPPNALPMISSKFLGLMSPWYEHPADSSRMMIPAYQNALQMFPIFRMQFALLNDLCMQLLSVVKNWI